VQLYFLKYATDVLLVAPLAVGAVFAAGRLWDAIADPMAGAWSDRTRSRWGRRRPWLLAAAAPMALAFAALWNPAAGATPVPWLAAALILFFTAQSLFHVPHVALAVELAEEGHARARLYATRALFEGAGIATAVLALHVLENSGDVRASARWIAPALGALAATGLGAAALGLRERPPATPTATPLARAVTEVWRHPPARRLLGVAVLMDLGLGSLASALPYASEYLLRTPGATASYIASFLVPMMLSLPFWVRASRRIGRRRSWLLGNALCAVGFAAVLGVGEGDALLLHALSAWIGVSHGAARALGPSVQADVTEWDAQRSGSRREGLHFAVWNLGSKVGAAASLALTGWLLQLAGFEPGVPLGAAGERAIRVACALLPALALAASAWLLAGLAPCVSREPTRLDHAPSPAPVI
jgi:GPH family glycoside/pentoside/hexuronide:cation symporter